MGIFGSILSKLGFGEDKVAAAEVAAATPEAAEAAAPVAEAAPVPATMDMVDVLSKLEELAAAQDGDLNWQTSIVDLLKLLGLESSFGTRKTLAGEVGISGYEGTAEQNIRLHKVVLQKIAENGGNVPGSLIG